ncbi:DUF3099 domain-containing protein [Pseudonocardia sp. KRD291]|uniref:DUF3099 domain-containing protein n=1 Tax=Pseudonocardia sp. KRD291 TaxID=2792007 RepID=UPI001C4A1F9B|nr:DUF3099 domain-containing protein [Pseudonocardia sp. KRD291]MBW0102853.1 DUF3099 domain-containing protein [Pseudonocardia sp. KRD291]
MTEHPSRRPSTAPALITDAPMSYEQELVIRKRRYALMMGMRIPLMIAAVVFVSVPWVAVTLLLASVPLPWMAVLIANDRLPRKAEKVSRFRSRPHELESRDHPVIES